MKQPFGALFLLAVLLGPPGQPAEAAPQEPVEFRNPTVESHYPDSMTFRVEICGQDERPSIDFDYTADPHPGTDSIWIDAGQTYFDRSTADGCYVQKISLDAKQFRIAPFTLLHYYWSFGSSSSQVSSSPIYVYYYTDSTQAWKTLANRNLIVRWHDRPESFAQDVMSIASIAYQDQATFYNGSLDEPISVVITNTEEEFDAWQLESNYAAGMAFPESYLTIQQVEDEVYYQPWLSDVIPHEISHIYFGHLVEKDRSLPRWLNEGFATYLEYSNHWEEWQAISEAVDTDSVRTLKELGLDFGDEEPQVHYAYAQSYYAILYMDEVYGKEAVATFLAELGDGNSTVPAFLHAFGVDQPTFESDYLVWLETRIETPPPSTALPSQGVDAGLARQFGFTLAMILCFSPVVLVGCGLLGIAELWVLNDLLSAKNQAHLR